MSDEFKEGPPGTIQLGPFELPPEFQMSSGALNLFGQVGTKLEAMQTEVWELRAGMEALAQQVNGIETRVDSLQPTVPPSSPERFFQEVTDTEVVQLQAEAFRRLGEFVRDSFPNRGHGLLHVVDRAIQVMGELGEERDEQCRGNTLFQSTVAASMDMLAREVQVHVKQGSPMDLACLRLADILNGNAPRASLTQTPAPGPPPPDGIDPPLAPSVYKQRNERAVAYMVSIPVPLDFPTYYGYALEILMGHFGDHLEPFPPDATTPALSGVVQGRVNKAIEWLGNFYFPKAGYPVVKNWCDNVACILKGEPPVKPDDYPRMPTPWQPFPFLNEPGTGTTDATEAVKEGGGSIRISNPPLRSVADRVRNAEPLVFLEDQGGPVAPAGDVDTPLEDSAEYVTIKPEAMETSTRAPRPATHHPPEYGAAANSDPVVFTEGEALENLREVVKTFTGREVTRQQAMSLARLGHLYELERSGP